MRAAEGTDGRSRLGVCLPLNERAFLPLDQDDYRLRSPIGDVRCRVPADDLWATLASASKPPTI
ncbi:MAG: hypothetical protein AAF543_20740, partial [Pseudomonadota bacterium]